MLYLIPKCWILHKQLYFIYIDTMYYYIYVHLWNVHNTNITFLVRFLWNIIIVFLLPRWVIRLHDVVMIYFYDVWKGTELAWIGRRVFCNMEKRLCWIHVHIYLHVICMEMDGEEQNNKQKMIYTPEQCIYSFDNI